MLTNKKMAFDEEGDVLGRKRYGEKLLKIINTMPNERVILLDARWGEGKTVFANMCQKYFMEEGHRTIYYDVFAHDYYEQPLLPFMEQIYQLVDEGKKENKIKAKKALYAVAKDILNITTAGAAENTIEQLFKAINQSKNNLNELKEYLTSLPDNMEDEYKDKPIIFIIDELDRCKPTYAIKILEIIKHLFSVPNIVFILVANSEQLCQSIKHEYGNDIDGYNYLHKFIHLRITLPKQKEHGHIIDYHQYIFHCIDELEFKKIVSGELINELEKKFIAFSNYYQLSFREIERSLLTTKIMLSLLLNPAYRPTYTVAIVFIVIIKNKFPNIYTKLSDQNITYEEFIEKTDLQKSIEEKNIDTENKETLAILINFNKIKYQKEVKDG